MLEVSPGAVERYTIKPIMQRTSHALHSKELILLRFSLRVLVALVRFESN